MTPHRAVRRALQRPHLPAWGGALVVVGSALTVASGVLHLYLWDARGYRQIPTVGPLFAAQAVGAILVGLAAVSRRPLAVIAAGLLMVATAGGLVLTVEVGLFGFRETWQTPWAVTSLIAELAAAALLGAGLVSGAHLHRPAPVMVSS